MKDENVAKNKTLSVLQRKEDNTPSSSGRHTANNACAEIISGYKLQE